MNLHYFFGCLLKIYILPHNDVIYIQISKYDILKRTTHFKA